MTKREHKKKPGEFARARARHRRRQAIQDAITAAKNNPGAPVELVMYGGKWELTGLRPDELPSGGLALVRISGKKLLIGYVGEKDGLHIDVPNAGRFFISDSILGYVRPADDAAKAWLGEFSDDLHARYAAEYARWRETVYAPWEQRYRESPSTAGYMPQFRAPQWYKDAIDDLRRRQAALGPHNPNPQPPPWKARFRFHGV